MQCIEPKEVWEAYNEDAEDAGCLFGTKHGTWKGLYSAQGSVGAACVAAPGAGVCVASCRYELHVKRKDSGWTIPTLENSP